MAKNPGLKQLIQNNNTTQKKTELLAPAKDFICGKAAIDCGADAVYIGANKFGARSKAINSIADIEKLVNYAHQYYCNVYVTINTILYDNEIDEAVKLCHQLNNIGIDGLIIQDMGLLESNLPPIPLIASTQTFCDTPEKVKFLEDIGFKRAILPRELSLNQIKLIREATTKIELEYFIHGALCVSYSGQCYMSYAIGGRSGNRGECAQPCRRLYDLQDSTGRVIHKKYLLSLKDMNQSGNLFSLLESGISSFKIEGRLKDITYVKNVVSYYRSEIDNILKNNDYYKTSSGISYHQFTPDISKTFNRNFTTYFINGRKEHSGSIDTPKMTGEKLGEVIYHDDKSFKLSSNIKMNNGDGVCFFNDKEILTGTTINKVINKYNFPQNMDGIIKDKVIYRNHDHAFLKTLNKTKVERKINININIDESPEGLLIKIIDENKNELSANFSITKIIAENPENTKMNIKKQFTKTGGTIYKCIDVTINLNQLYFIPISELNNMRRNLLQKFSDYREKKRPVETIKFRKNDIPFPNKTLSYSSNVLNKKAEAFYKRHGVSDIEPAVESGLNMLGKKVMQMKYCIKHQLGYCTKYGGEKNIKDDLFLIDEDGRQFKLNFDCKKCEMEVWYEKS